MSEFNELTSFIKRFDNIEYGTWIIDKENDGSSEHPIQIPYVEYNRIVSNFIHSVYDFHSAHPEYNLVNYQDILKSQSIEWSKESMEGAIIDDLDAKTVLAIIMGIVRADRFCEGTILSMLKNGTIQRCLSRLEEIDNS